MLKRIFVATLLGLALLGPGPLHSVASACPMCKEANESAEENNRPKAYMYSILFMLSMPPLVLGGFGLAFYRMTKKAREAEYARLAEAERNEFDLEGSPLFGQGTEPAG